MPAEVKYCVYAPSLGSRGSCEKFSLDVCFPDRLIKSLEDQGDCTASGDVESLVMLDGAFIGEHWFCTHTTSTRPLSRRGNHEGIAAIVDDMAVDETNNGFVLIAVVRFMKEYRAKAVMASSESMPLASYRKQPEARFGGYDIDAVARLCRDMRRPPLGKASASMTTG